MNFEFNHEGIAFEVIIYAQLIGADSSCLQVSAHRRKGAECDSMKTRKGKSLIMGEMRSA